MKLAKVTTRGRVTIPTSLRKKHKLTPGIKVNSLVTHEEIKANIGFLGTKGKFLKALMREKKFECEL
ncbi:MAG: AbrB/MazE/SpoVT family DNA-binding domain-containing protein [Ignavibacteriaceae bacterium]|nr:AbrB/MazE/SpoVT family DNA-binding domain-containing protein [Ignavibacteriaceae bacterium]